jgi:hypothetical protein
VNDTAKHNLGDDDENHTDDNVQRGIGHPKNAEQADVFANSRLPLFDESENSFAATSAARRSFLQLHSTLIAKHNRPRGLRRQNAEKFVR